MALLLARQEKETDNEVKKSLIEAVALLQLGSVDPQVQITAVKKLASLKSIGGLNNLKRLATEPKTGPEVLRETQLAISSIEQHISWVNFFSTMKYQHSFFFIHCFIAHFFNLRQNACIHIF